MQAGLHHHGDEVGSKHLCNDADLLPDYIVQ
jgi:hypothetical protein